MPDFNNMVELNIGLLSFSIVITLFILMGIAFEQEKKTSYMKSFICLICMNIIMQSGELGIWILEMMDGSMTFIKICSFFSYGGGVMIIMFYTYCIIEFIAEKTKVSYLPAYIVTAACIVYLILVVISVFNGILYSVDENGNYLDGKYAWLSWLFDPAAMLADIGILVYYRKYMRKVELLGLLSFYILAIITMNLQDIWYPVPEFMVTTLSLILSFMLFYGNQSKKLAEKEKELVENRIAIMISQIQPHFIYNTLSTISELCQKEPVLAEEVTTKFAQYLRGNLENIGELHPVAFSKELQHIKTYLWIEKMRFQDDLYIVYDIKTEKFKIPSLVVQSLVENSIKHGLMGSEGVCTVKISTREKRDVYEIIVEDNGCGFNMEEVKHNKKHIGIDNVKKRIELMVNGKLLIESEIGKGTKVKILLPRERGEGTDEDTCS